MDDLTVALFRAEGVGHPTSPKDASELQGGLIHLNCEAVIEQNELKLNQGTVRLLDLLPSVCHGLPDDSHGSFSVFDTL